MQIAPKTKRLPKKFDPKDLGMKDLSTANLPANIVDFGGFDSSIILILRGGIPRPIGDFPKSSSQAMLVGAMFVGRLGVLGVAVRQHRGGRIWKSGSST